MTTRPAQQEPPGTAPIKLTVSLPRRVRIPGCTAGVGATSLAGMLAGHRIDPSAVATWPLVVLVLGAMAYDIALRVVQRKR